MSDNSTSSNSSLSCAFLKVSIYMFHAMVIFKVLLLLPLSTFVLYLGYQRWRQQRSSKTATHSDIFTYNVAAMELVFVFGSFFYLGGSYTNDLLMTTVGIKGSVLVYYAEICFHLVTCVERYLAVVHPITYRGLRNARGVRIRNICIGCAWLLSFVMLGVTAQHASTFKSIPYLCLYVPSIIVLSFCSLSVLCVLIRPGPGDRGEEKDQSKQRAFYTITAISATVWLWFVGLLVAMAVNMSPLLGPSVGCLVTACVGWLNLPSSLVSPLLYLHRAGKLSCCW